MLWGASGSCRRGLHLTKLYQGKVTAGSRGNNMLVTSKTGEGMVPVPQDGQDRV